MASPSERNRNNIRAGVFVSVSIIIGLAVLIILTDAIGAITRVTDRYIVTFDVASGVANLKSGSDVRVGGVRMGQVSKIEPQLEEGQAFRKIDVRFNLDRRVVIYSNAHVLVSAPILGSDAWLDIPNVGDPSAGRPPGGRLVGVSSVGMLTSLLGSENATKANEMVENVRQFSAFLGEVPDEYQKRIVPVIDNVGSVAGDAKVVVQDIRQTHWPTWADAVDKVLTWATGATGKLDGAIDEGKGLLADSRTVVNENRPQIKSIVDNLTSTTQTLNTQTIDKFHKFLDTGQQGLDQAVAVLEDMRIDYGSWATNLGEVLANANLASQQLKLTTIETRRSPWKLLYRPSPDELQHELLYEAARSFAVAAADLKAASQSVQRILDQHADKIAGDEDAYRRLERNLVDSLAKYEKAQQQLLDVIVADHK